MSDSDAPAKVNSTVGLGAWQPIETVPESGYMLVYEDGAMRALLRHRDGRWAAPSYPALVTITPPGLEYQENVMVGHEAARFLRPHGLRLELRDGFCEKPTHWMPLPAPPPVVNDEPNVRVNLETTA